MLVKLEGFPSTENMPVLKPTSARKGKANEQKRWMKKRRGVSFYCVKTEVRGMPRERETGGCMRARAVPWLLRFKPQLEVVELRNDLTSPTTVWTDVTQTRPPSVFMHL